MKQMISNDEIAGLCYELSMLLGPGEDTSKALSLLAEEGQWKDLLKDMADQVDSGKALSTVLRESGVFPKYVYEMVWVGEENGCVAEALEGLSKYYENRVRLARRVRSALLYPAVMLALMLVVIGVLLVKVLPIFDDVYASLGGRLTGVAAGLLALGRWLEGAMPVLFVLLVVLAIAAVLFAVVPGFRAALTAFWQKGHGDKGVTRKLNNARLAQAMAMGMAAASGRSVYDALGQAEKLVDGGAKERCETCRKLLEEGVSLGDALRQSDLLPAQQRRLLEVGQRSGTEDTAMEKIARDLDEEAETELDAIVGRVEPALVLVCSVLVGLILLSVMLPLMHIMSAIG